VSELPVLIEGALPGAITNLAGLFATLSSAKAFPPGQPLAFTLRDSGLQVQARSIGSKRSGEHFELRVRLINMRREAREALAQAWASVQPA